MDETPAPKGKRRTCGAETRSEDKHPCGNQPEKGTNRCRFHGARTPGALATKGVNIAYQEAERRALTLLRKEKIEPVTNPWKALSDLAGTIVAWQRVMHKMVDRLDTLRYDGLESGEQIRGEVLLFERSMDRAASVLTAMARLDIDTRLVRIEEQQAEGIERALLGAMYDIHLDPTVMEKLLAATAKRLRREVVA